MNNRVWANICQEYFDTKDNENCYMACNAHGESIIEGVIVTNAGYYYAHLYDGWKDLYKTNVRYAIKEDFDDIGEDDVRDYLDEEAFEYVYNDLFGAKYEPKDLDIEV